MAFGAVSFAELLGHCGEALKVYARHTDAIETRPASFGYVLPVAELEADAEEDEGGAPGISCFGGSGSVLRSRGRFDDEDALFEESVSLKNLGLSDACLAALSFEATDFPESPVKLYKKPESREFQPTLHRDRKASAHAKQAESSKGTCTQPHKSDCCTPTHEGGRSRSRSRSVLERRDSSFESHDYDEEFHSRKRARSARSPNSKEC